MVYDGKDDLDIFDQWVYEVDTWKDLYQLGDRQMIQILVQFMSGKASRFFMKHVAMRQCDWTLKSIYKALFEYCFPSDFIMRLRERLTVGKQEKRDVRDFHRDIETIAVRFPDVSEGTQTNILGWNSDVPSLGSHWERPRPRAQFNAQIA